MAFGLVCAAVFIIPIIWMVLSAIRPEKELYEVPIRLLPKRFTLEYLQSAWVDKSFSDYFYNSLINSLISVLFSMGLALPAGYVLSRINFGGKSFVRSYILFAYMVPIIILIVPFYLILTALGLYDTRMGHVLGLSTYSIPFAVWVMTGYFEQIPREIDDAAMVCGATRLQAMVYATLPVALPGLVATALITFVVAWDDYIFALILLDGERLRTLPLAIGYLASDYEVTESLMMAMGTITTIPIFVLFVFFQKYFVSGLTSGAVKG